MPLVFGINHHKTPLDVRERMNFSATQLPIALRSLMAQPGVQEAIILSTCNRTEIYTNDLSPLVIQNWLLQEKSINDVNLNAYSYAYHGEESIKHVMRVASGLDSMILGEPQVLGQLKEAYFTAENTNTVGELFKQLFPSVFTTSKYIRTNTEIGTHPVSLAYTILQLAKTVFENLTPCRVLLIGAGETIELIATHLHHAGIHNITIASRTTEKSERIAKSIQATVISMREIREALKNNDIIITATTSQLPIVGKGMVENALSSRHLPLLLIDLAVPRDIEPEVATLPNVNLYNIDQLQTIITENIGNRQAAAHEAEMIIASHAELFQKKMRVFQMRHVITQYRERLEKIRDEEYEKALRQLQRGIDPHIVLQEFGVQLINKIMHHPTMKIREAAAGEECAALQQIKAFFEAE